MVPLTNSLKHAAACRSEPKFSWGPLVPAWHPPYGPWGHVPPHVWTDESNLAAMEDDGEDEVDVCALCCHTHSTVTVYDECKHYCCECIDTHTRGNNYLLTTF